MFLLKAVANLLVICLMALLTIPAVILLYLASIPIGFLAGRKQARLTKAEVETLRDHARLRHSGEHYAGGL